jgi:hypothetical protein
MAVGLKNDLDQIPDLVGDFDFAVNEQCAQSGECADLKPFVAADRAGLPRRVRTARRPLLRRFPPSEAEFDAQKYDLGAWRKAC